MRQAPLKMPMQITVNWSGKEPLAIPKERPDDKQRFIQPGDNTIPLSSWHRMGAVAANCDHVAEGRLSVVHRRHEFAVNDDHCIGCSMTRGDVEAERVASGAKKAVPAAPVACARGSIGCTVSPHAGVKCNVETANDAAVRAAGLSAS